MRLKSFGDETENMMSDDYTRTLREGVARR